MIPTYQLNLIRHKPEFGIKLSAEVQSLVDSTPASPDSEFFKYLKQIYPNRLRDIALETKLTPIANYQANYTASMLLIKAYSKGLLSSLDSSEVKNFASAYRRYILAHGIRFYGGLEPSLPSTWSWRDPPSLEPAHSLCKMW